MDDIDPETFQPAPDGKHIFGEVDADIAKAIGCKAGPIRLKHGYPHANGFGKTHIESHVDRMKQIRGLGFNTVELFVYEIAQNYTVVQDGGEGRLILVHKKLGYDLRIVIDAKSANDGSAFWNVITAMPYRVSRAAELYVIVRSDGSEPAPNDAVRSRFATLSLPEKD